MEPSQPLTLTFLALIFSFVLVGLNGFFVAAEFAIVKVRRTRLEELAGQGVKAARTSIVCVDQLDQYLSATQLGITLVSLALGWIGEEAFANLIFYFIPPTIESHAAVHIGAVAMSFLMVTLLHVVLGELVPKSMAIQNAEKITLWIARPLNFFYRASHPIIRLFNSLAAFVLRRLGYDNLQEPPLSEQELKLVMKESTEEGVISESEAQIINRAFEFADKRAIDIMVPVHEVDYLSMSRPIEENLAFVKKHMHTRFPLCHTDFSTVFAIVHMKDAWPILLQDMSNESLVKAARSLVRIESSLRQDLIMKTFQKKQIHLAVVEDMDSKEPIGIVSLEDVLVKLVGEIFDEHGN